MKKLRRKNGFTLVECVVAMAVLAIMSLLLMMILSVTLKTRNNNMQLESDIDKQVENLASGNGAVTESYNDGIAFDGFTIPGNSTPNVSANKASGDQNGLSRLEFDFEKYFDDMGEPPKLGSDKDDEKVEVGDWEKTAPCFGYIDLKEKVYITETKTYDETAKTYDIKWNVQFTVNSYSAVDSVKFTLPVGSKFTGWSTPTGAEYKPQWESDGIGYTRKLTKYILMIRPNDKSADPDPVKTELKVEVDLKFTISEEDYNENYKNLASYFGVGDFPDQTSIGIVPTNN